MQLHIITVGVPKLPYAQLGWQEYTSRLKHYHRLHITHLPDKRSNPAAILKTAGAGYIIALTDSGQQFTSPALAQFLDREALRGSQICFIIGGPDGLPEAVLSRADYLWSLGLLTFPHDLAMILCVESLYRAATISAGLPYHK